MEVNNVSFTGLRQTKNGNVYKKKNTAKRIGTVVGLAGGVAAAIHPEMQGRAVVASLDMLRKYAVGLSPAAIIGGVVIGATLLGRGIGSFFDHFANKKRKAKADAAVAAK